jgi:hypothetical protein
MASTGLTWAANNGISPEQYYQNIFDYVNANRGLNDVQLKAEMDKYGISPEDVAAATGVPLEGVQARYDTAPSTGSGSYVPTNNETQSAGLAWGLANGMTQAQIDKNIFDFVNANRGMNDQQLRAEMDKWGISPADVARATGVALGGVQARYDVANTATNVPARVTDVTNLIAKKPATQVTPAFTVGNVPQNNVTAGQLRDLFPAFSESKRLAEQMVANRPTTQSIVNMIQGTSQVPSKTQSPVTAPTSLMDAWKTAEATKNYGDVANMLKGLTTNDLRNYGASDADIAYITSRPQIAGAMNTASPSLSNVLSMIAK